MGLFHVRFGARPQAKPSIISVYKLSPISAKWVEGGRSNLPEFLISIKLSTQQHNPIISPFLSPSPPTLLQAKNFHFISRSLFSCATTLPFMASGANSNQQQFELGPEKCLIDAIPTATHKQIKSSSFLATLAYVWSRFCENHILKDPYSDYGMIS